MPNQIWWRIKSKTKLKHVCKLVFVFPILPCNQYALPSCIVYTKCLPRPNIRNTFNSKKTSAFFSVFCFSHIFPHRSYIFPFIRSSRFGFFFDRHNICIDLSKCYSNCKYFSFSMGFCNQFRPKNFPKKKIKKQQKPRTVEKCVAGGERYASTEISMQINNTPNAQRDRRKNTSCKHIETAWNITDGHETRKLCVSIE